MGLKSFLLKFLQGDAIATNYFLQQGIAIYGDNSAANNINDGYAGNGDVYSIIKRIAETAATQIPIQGYRQKNKQSVRKYLDLIQQKNYSPQHMVKMAMAKIEAFEPLEASHPFQQLIDNPNPLYTKTEFLSGIYTFRLATGNYYVMQLAPEFGATAKMPTELWMLPPQATYPIITQGFPKKVLGYQMNWDKVYTLKKEDVIHGRYFNPQFSIQGNELIGLSPLKVAAKRLQKSNDIDDYEVAAFQNGGIAGIISNESIPFDSNAKELTGRFKQDFYAEASGKHNAKKLVVTPGKVNYTHVGLSPVDLDVLNAKVKNFKSLCNIYGVSDRLFNNDAVGSEISQELAYKDLFTNACLPEVANWVDCLNRDVAPKFKDNVFAMYDISAIPVLQSDIKKMVDAFAASPVMIPNSVLEAQGFGRIEDPLMDKVFIKNGYQLIEDMQLPNL